MSTTKALPPLENLLLNTPLYEAFTLTDADADEVYHLNHFTGSLDAYCGGCQQMSVFRNVVRHMGVGDPPAEGRTLASLFDRLTSELNFTVDLMCSRNMRHRLRFYFRLVGQTFMKVGQYPALADLHTAEIGRYRAILDKEQYRELARAVGLAAHGVGIGSFVYLRRIFERLIEEAHQVEAAASGWDEQQYSKSRMDEKIMLLKDRLPSFLVENKGLYAILSKGIHELREQECLQYFATVRLGIELILDEKIEQETRRRKIEEARRAITDIRGKL